MPSARLLAPRPLKQCLHRSRTSICKTTTRHLSIAQLDAQRGGRSRIVILGSGWAGYSLSRALDARKHQIVVVSPRTYFVFTPLLASTAVGTLEFRTALEPVRSFRARKAGAEFFQGWADGVDFDGKTLRVEAAVGDPVQSRALTAEEGRAVVRKKGEVFDLSYDKLVVAVGCYAQTFGTKGVREHAFFLKDVGDARRIRTRLLACFETASLPTTSDEMRKHLLHFAIVGGGPTGIEFAAELHDSVYEDLARLYPELMPHFKITIYDVAPTVLGMFDAKLTKYATESFARENIDIRTSHHVEELRLGSPSSETIESADHDSRAGTTAIQPYTLHVTEDGPVGVGMCVWSTGLMANPFVATALDERVARHPKTGSILTDDRMRVLAPSSSSPSDQDASEVITDVFAVGDCASISATPLPATAQVADQEARWLAKRLNAGDVNAEGTQGFTFRNMGVMAYIGGWRAIFQGGGKAGGPEISGRMAWVVWRSVYLAKSVSWRNRVLIPVYWAINWLFGRDISRF